jgi:spermidine/putrescine transport system permease protein
MAGALLAFTLSIDDFVISFFVAGPGSTTLPIHIYSMIKRGSMPLINALSTILLAITFLAILAYQIISRHNRPQDD